jgi:hypothetical protein
MPTPRINLVCAIAIFAALAGPTAAATADEAAATRVRSSTAAIRQLVERARTSSATLNRLVEAFHSTDGIVYIEPGRCRPGIRSCLLVSVTPAGEYRILRIALDMRRADWDMAGAIGHELQHALEVLHDRTVTSGSAMFFFYKNRAHIVGGIFETDSAIVAGDAVRAELRQRRADDPAADGRLALARVP